MGMGFIEIIMLIVMNGGGGTDLLDYVPTDFYWEQNSVRAVTPQAMHRIMEDDSADDIDRLMAIRAMGELGDESSLTVLEALIDSNEPFVGRYARRSIAWIGGVEPEHAAQVTAEQLNQDLALLPLDVMLVAQSSGLSTSTGPIDMYELLPDMGGQGGPSKKEMIERMAEQVMMLVEAVGNVQLDALTFGMGFEEDGDDPTIVVVVARGQYDRARVRTMLEEESNGEMDFFTIDDIEVAQQRQEWGDRVVLMMPDNERLVFMFASDEEIQLPLDETAMLLGEGETELSLGGMLLDQLDHIDRSNTPIWMVMEVPAMLKENEPGEIFGAFDAIRMTGVTDDEGNLVVNAVGQGTDAGAVAQTAEVLRGYIGEGIMELEEGMQREPEMRAMFEPMLGMLRSIELEAQGDTLTGEMKFPGGAGGLLGMMFMGRAF